MLEHVPQWLGSLLKNVRAGHSKLVIVDKGIVTSNARIVLGSPAFADGARIPDRFTADGVGVSPPLVWSEVPPCTVNLALIVEDPDAPAPNPLVHAIVWDLAPDERGLAEGAIARDGNGSADGFDVGRNSYLTEGWLPPDPPNGARAARLCIPALRALGDPEHRAQSRATGIYEGDQGTRSRRWHAGRHLFAR